MLCLVEQQAAASRGVDPAAPFVSSRRSNQEKQPWRNVAGLEHSVEAEFLRPVLVGESILPYRILRPPEGVIPVSGSTLLDAKGAASRGFAGLQGWMSAAEVVWQANAQRDDLALTDRWNQNGGLAGQFPLAPLRVTYAVAGAIPAACLVRQSRAVIEHGVYWAAVATEDEGRYLAAVLNSATTRVAIRELRARGLWGARLADQIVFTLPIAQFDPAVSPHRELAATAAEAEAIAAAVEHSEQVRFQRARRSTHDALAKVGVSERIDWLVAQLLTG
jgi:hypothetical protein